MSVPLKGSTSDQSSKQSNSNAPSQHQTLLGTNLTTLPLPYVTVPTNAFSTPFTPREEELQSLLSQERLRSEQRRSNYNSLKEEHLRLQNEFLGLQAEMKQVLEETVYFKDKKNTELDQLLLTIEEKTKQVDKLEKAMRENEPEVIR